MKTKIIAKAVVFNDDGQVLLLRRSATDKRRPLEQDFPGGGVNYGEDFTRAVIREIYEEAGLQVPFSDIHLFYTNTQKNHDRNEIRLLFWVRLHNPSVKLSFEHDEFHWTSPEAAIQEFPHPVYGAGLQYGLDIGLFSA